MNLFINPRHCNENGRPYLEQSARQFLEEGAISQGHPAIQQGDVRVARGHVRQRQKRYADMPGMNIEAAHRMQNIRSQIAVRQPHSLRRARGPGCVNNRRQIVGRDLTGALFQFQIALLWRFPQQPLHLHGVAGFHAIHHDHCFHRSLILDKKNFFKLPGRGDDHNLRPGIAKNVGSLLRGQSRIDGHYGSA